ncbi:serine/threonine-protein kinase [Tessaracoccus sp. Z1128]
MQADAVLGNRYRLSHLLASGGMGQVWQAHDAVLGREVAVKLLSAGSSDPAALERFRREAVAMAALQHPNTVLVFDIGTHQAWTYIVMELLPGPTLAQLVASRGPLPEAEVAGLGAQVAAGLAAAHRAGIVHRDIKPGNLMLGPSGELKVVDFGVARLSQSAAPALTATNTVVGSALYVSPEQAAGAPADERSDLYALGCVLMTLATGLPPFESEHVIGALHQHVQIDPPLLRARRPEASAALEALIGELLAKQPDDRPASAAEVAARLRDIESSARDTAAVPALIPDDSTARLPGATAVMTTAASAAAAALQPGAPASPPSSTRADRAWWVAGAVLVSSGVLAAMAWTQNPTSEGDPGTPTTSVSPSPSTTPSASVTPSASAAPVASTAQPATHDDEAQDTTPPGKAVDETPGRGKSEEKKATTTKAPTTKAKPTKAAKK